MGIVIILIIIICLFFLIKINKVEKPYNIVSPFVKEIEKIKSKDIKDAALCLVDKVPVYFWKVPASSSGKYHPLTDLGEGGLVRHSINVKRMLDHLLTLNGYFEMTGREKDLLRVAALFHDCMKSGSQEEYEKDPHTKFMHPIYASDFIKENMSLPESDIEFICKAVESHMGQWNRGTLPLPETTAQKALHLADYLASRKGIEMK